MPRATRTTKQPSETEALKEFILWARKNHVVIEHIHIGKEGAQVTFRDPHAMADRDIKPDNVAQPRQSIYQEFGGEMMQPAAPTTAQNEPTEEDEDE